MTMAKSRISTPTDIDLFDWKLPNNALFALRMVQRDPGRPLSRPASEIPQRDPADHPVHPGTEAGAIEPAVAGDGCFGLDVAGSRNHLVEPCQRA
jgi:hypothetical protein